jgi:predicted nucleic acid-binding protein
LADTFYWIALTNPADPYYRDVIARRDEIADARILTTDAVLSEFLTFFAGDKRLRDRAGRTVQALLEDPDSRVIPESRQTFLAGLELYRARPDKGYSLTDCVSMRTMSREGLTDVLNNDRHFGQEGFRVLFRSS